MRETYDKYANPDEFCPGCGDSVTHPLYKTNYAPGVRLIGQPLTGWHNVCAEEQEAIETGDVLLKERAAILSSLLLGGDLEQVKRDAWLRRSCS